jgi:quinolinate synthase
MGESFLPNAQLGQWTKETNRLSVDTVKGICTVQCNFKNMSCEEFHTYIRGVPALLKETGSTEKYACI